MAAQALIRCRWRAERITCRYIHASVHQCASPVYALHGIALSMFVPVLEYRPFTPADLASLHLAFPEECSFKKLGWWTKAFHGDLNHGRLHQICAGNSSRLSTIWGNVVVHGA